LAFTELCRLPYLLFWIEPLHLTFFQTLRFDIALRINHLGGGENFLGFTHVDPDRGIHGDLGGCWPGLVLSTIPGAEERVAWIESALKKYTILKLDRP
jgi:hypothetical protein